MFSTYHSVYLHDLYSCPGLSQGLEWLPGPSFSFSTVLFPSLPIVFCARYADSELLRGASSSPSGPGKSSAEHFVTTQHRQHKSHISFDIMTYRISLPCNQIIWLGIGTPCHYYNTYAPLIFRKYFALDWLIAICDVKTISGAEFNSWVIRFKWFFRKPQITQITVLAAKCRAATPGERRTIINLVSMSLSLSTSQSLLCECRTAGARNSSAFRLSVEFSLLVYLDANTTFLLQELTAIPLYV